MPTKKSLSPRPPRKKKKETISAFPESGASAASEIRFEQNGFSPSPRFYRTIALSFLGLTVLLVVLVIFFTTGKAAISLKFKPQSTKVVNQIRVAGKALNNQLAGLVLATTIKGEKQFSPSGGEEVPAAATGQAVIYNKTKTVQPLIATTRLLSPEKVLFRLKNSVVVPAGGQVQAEVYADKPGREGEIGPTRFTIPGLSEIKQKDIYAESKTKMTGGVRRLAAITAADLEKAEQTLIEGLFSNGREQLKNLTKATSSVFTASLFSSEKSFVKTEAKAGTVADIFKLNGEIKVVGVFYNPVDLRNILLAAARENLAASQELGQNTAAPIITLKRYDLAAKTAELEVSQEFLVKINYSDKLLDKNKLLGQSKEQATEYLKGLPWLEKVEIKTRPSWLVKIPAEPSRVEIKVSE